MYRVSGETPSNRIEFHICSLYIRSAFASATRVKLSLQVDACLHSSDCQLQILIVLIVCLGRLSGRGKCRFSSYVVIWSR